MTMIARLIYSVVTAVLLGVVFSSALAQPPLAWDALSQAEKQVLQPYAGQWAELGAQQQQQLRDIAATWKTMTPEQRAALRDRLTRWENRPESDKQQIRDNYRRFKQLPPEQQQRILQRYESFRQLPADEQRDLKQKWIQNESKPNKATNDSAPAGHGESETTGEKLQHQQGREETSEPAGENDRQADPQPDQSRPLPDHRIRPERTHRPMRRAR
ncbi:MAG: DUF3106 domain-containing protein [Pseudomonadota bacterium]|nr:DUF3106 domain-containing protein [Pseudomonadota bacterium]